MENINIKIGSENYGKNLYEYLVDQGFSISADCAGRGLCGKCKVKILSGKFFKDASLSEYAVADSDGMIRSCAVWCSDKDSEISLCTVNGGGIESFSAVGTEKPDRPKADIIRVCAAVDIGTTTLAFALLNAENGEIIKTTSCLNPQRSCGADVMSRITAAAKGKLPLMQSSVLDVCRKALTEMLSAENLLTAERDRLVVTGNTVMLHIFCGISPEGMGSYPFKPAFLERKEFAGSEIGLDFEKVTVMPSVSAFIGADIAAGAYACELTKSDEPVIIADIGTNGEMILFTGKKHGGKLYAASAAAGPAMEGAGISTGVGGISGAVNSVTLNGENICTSTIENAPAIGICGSGIIDLVSVLLKTKRLDESGYLEVGTFVYAENGKNSLSIDQNDIRAFQLAKGAIRAAFDTLVIHSGINAENIDTVYLSGGLGCYMNGNSAVEVGLFPENVLTKIKCLGNSALGGAVKLLREGFAEVNAENSENELKFITQSCETVDLNFSSTFNDLFIEHMMFPEKA